MILSDAIYTARRPHWCDQCGRRIAVGERYRRQVHDEDGFAVYRAHEDCDAAAEEATANAGSALNRDESILVCDMIEGEYGDWARAKYPAVAARKGWV